MKGTGTEATRTRTQAEAQSSREELLCCRFVGFLRYRCMPDCLDYERNGLSPDTVAELQRRGHTLRVGGGQGVAQVIVFNQKEDMLEGGTDHRASDGGAVGVPGRPTPARSSPSGPRKR